MSEAFLPGTSVMARGLVWEVVECDPAGEQSRLRLRCLDGELRGEEIDLLIPIERVQPKRRDFVPERPGRLSDWRLYHQAYLLEQELGPRALLAAEPGRLDPQPYQLVPVMRALEMGRPRLMLADGVGLGKTVQAGIVITELIARRRTHRVLIVSPAGTLLSQWDRELRSRFGLRFTTIADWGSLQEERRKLELGANPFNATAFCLTSVDFAKQEKVLQDLERSTWDLIIIDEAHHCMRVAGEEREDSQRRRLAEALARIADGLLLLTATPHDGYDAHFASLLELLDPSLVDGRGGLRGDAYRRHVIRRLKSHLHKPGTTDPMFPTREVAPCKVVPDPDERPAFAAFQRALLEFVSPRLRRALRDKRYAEVLAFVTLLKRSVSTLRAVRNTLERVSERYERLREESAGLVQARQDRLRTLREYRRRMERFGTLTFEEEEDQASLEAEDIAQELLEAGGEELDAVIQASERDRRRARADHGRFDKAWDAVQALIDLADLAMPEDPKLPALVARIAEIRQSEPDANVLVYTEYTDSQDAVVDFLARAAAEGALSGRVERISGRDGDEVRMAITGRFTDEDGIVLVSTDATAEGLNLHERCHHLIHLELPYNPNRLEQRNGRIDRYGQTHTPQVRYLYMAGTFEERLLLRLIAKYERQRASLTFMPNTLGVLADESQTATVRLLQGLAEEQGLLFQHANTELKHLEQVDDGSTTVAYQEMLAEVDRAIAGYERAGKTHNWYLESGLNAEQRTLDAADEALRRGVAVNGTPDLVAFVRDAIESEAGTGGNTLADGGDGVLTLSVPSDWAPGLDGLPGFERETRQLRFSRDRTRMHDAQKRALGYIGRAHPLLRRAIDRVRRIESLGAADLLDRRVSVALADPGAPATLLLTFVGTVRSPLGVEYQRVIAVRVTAEGDPEVLGESPEWIRFADDRRALSGRGVWEKRFAGWVPAQQNAAIEAAALAFRALTDVFVGEHRLRTERDLQDLGQWVRLRANDLCGAAQPATGDLFAPADGRGAWQSLTDPVQRLAAFAVDRGASPRQRTEAEAVVKLYKQRLDEIERRGRLTIERPQAVGMLMLVPSEA